jgi:hypothetical protein
VLAGDVHGLPWLGERDAPSSHGTWGYHDNCMTLQKLTLGSLDCVICGPRPGSRRYDVHRDDPYLLYLVRHRRLQKFGVGDECRVRAHIAGGAEVVQVLEARHADVVEAEMVLKRQKRAAAKRIWGWQLKRASTTFGVGTEVVPMRVPIDLMEVLSHGKDVTDRFASYRSWSPKFGK